MELRKTQSVQFPTPLFLAKRFYRVQSQIHETGWVFPQAWDAVQYPLSIMRITMFISRTLILASLAAALVGCRTTAPKETFFTSPYVIKDMGFRDCRGKLTLLEGFRARFGQYSNVLDHISLVETHLKAFHEGDVSLYRRFEQDYDPKTDHLFYYDYRDGDRQEQGWLILCWDEILKKYLLGSSSREP